MSTDDVVGPDYWPAVSMSEDGSLVAVWAVPGASKTEIAGLHGDAVRIRVSAPPEGGKANRALEDVLAVITGADVELVGGRGSRRKRFFVKGLSPAAVVRLISEQTG